MPMQPYTVGHTHGTFTGTAFHRIFTYLPDGRGARVALAYTSTMRDEASMRNLVLNITGATDARYNLTREVVDVIAPRDIREILRNFGHSLSGSDLVRLSVASLARNPEAIYRVLPEGAEVSRGALNVLRAGAVSRTFGQLGVYIDDGTVRVISGEENRQRLTVERHRERMRSLLARARSCGLDTSERRRAFRELVEGWQSARENRGQYWDVRWAYEPTSTGWVYRRGGVNAGLLSTFLRSIGQRVACGSCGASCEATPTGPQCGCQAWQTLSYGSSLDIEFRGEATPQSPRYVGVEIEVCGRDDSADGSAFLAEREARSGFLVRDGSLPDGGFELVTSPARGDALIDDLTAYGSHLQAAGAWVDGRAGAHCHVDARDLGPVERARVVCMYAHLERELYRGLAWGRDDEYDGEVYAGPVCESVSWARVLHRLNEDPNRLWNELVAGRQSPLYRPRDGAYRRYSGLNLESLSKHSTFEFRLWPGAVSAERLTLQALVSAHIVEHGARLDPHDYRQERAVDTLQRILPPDVWAAYQEAVSDRLYFASEDCRDHEVCAASIPRLTPQGRAVAEADLAEGWEAYLQASADLVDGSEAWPRVHSAPF
jgi:hypothetical protein